MQTAPPRFTELLAPLDLEKFLATHWEKSHFHSSGRGDRFAGLSRADFDHWLQATRGRLLVKPQGGTESSLESFRTAGLNLAAIYGSLGKGCPLILTELESLDVFAPLAADIGRFLHATTTIEALLVPPSAQPLQVFAANYDLYILQIAGERRWHLHRSTLLQYKASERTNFNFPLEWYGRTKTPVVAELTLGPGDVLYIPRGTPHQAVSQEDTSLQVDLHVTLLAWVDFLRVAAEYVGMYSDELRRSLAPGFVSDEKVKEAMRPTYERALEIFRERVSFDDVIAALRRNRISAQGFPADGHFPHLDELSKLTLNTRVRKREWILCAVEETVDIDRKRKAAIYYGNTRMLAPLRIRGALEFIRDRDEFLVSEVPSLDPKGKLTLVRRLIQDGLLKPSTGGRD